MKVLWFEVTTPSRYDVNSGVRAGWQDSLERIIRTIPDIELTVSFVATSPNMTEKCIEGVKYVPMNLKFSFFDKIKNKYSWCAYIRELDKEMKAVVSASNPDIIHVFGTEWLCGRIAMYTSIPVVIHIMGAIIPYNNALYPPGFSFKDIFESIPIWKPITIINRCLFEFKKKNWAKQEEEVWNCVKYYMGRTSWDKALSHILHPNRVYYHVDEALRTSFFNSSICWSVDNVSEKVKLITIGNSSFWKGPDMVLKTARILSHYGIDYEWNFVGAFDGNIKKMIEKKIGITYEECHVNICGKVNAEKLTSMLCESTIYVHTAYVENSPNSICEAQYLGLPVISTNVGGISTLVGDNKSGVLVPANDPWQLADAIVSLSGDKDTIVYYAQNSKRMAIKRHSDENIKEQLLSCYNAILQL